MGARGGPRGWPAAAVLAILAMGPAAPGAQAREREAPERLAVELTNGYRLDGLRWSIASDLTGTLTPNIYSELTWTDLRTYEIGAGLRARVGKMVLPASLRLGWVVSGKNQDSDYDGDDRTLEFSRSNNRAGGWLLDAAAGLGYPLVFESEGVEITPLVGLDYHVQHLTMFDGYQTIPPDGPFPDLDSSYRAHWLGMHLAGEAAAPLGPRVDLDVGIAAHAALYWAEADWNLRTEWAHPVSFAHAADGWGVSGRLGLNWHVHPHWSLGLHAEGELWRAGPGIDVLYFAAGGSVRTRLNEVLWRGAAVRLSTALRL